MSKQLKAHFKKTFILGIEV